MSEAEEEYSTGFPPFELVSFKAGLCMCAQIIALIFTFPMGKKAKVRSFVIIPFLIQILWSICGTTWISSFYAKSEAENAGLQIASNVSDFLAKALLIYFICIRLIYTIPFNRIREKVVWTLLIGFGILISFSCCVLLSVVIYIELEDSSVLLVAIWYQFADCYISILDLISFLAYVKHKFKAESLQTLLQIIIDLDLTKSLIITILSAVLSFCLLLLCYTGLDDDLNFNGTLAAIKYAVSCHLVLEVFRNTLSSEAKNKASNAQEAVMSRKSKKGTILSSMKPISEVSARNCRAEIGSLQISMDEGNNPYSEVDIKLQNLNIQKELKEENLKIKKELKEEK